LIRLKWLHSVRAANGHGEEILKPNGYGAILLGVPLPEGLRKPLHLHAEHDELVHRHLLVGLGITLLHQKVDELGREAKSHLGESCGGMK